MGLGYTLLGRRVPAPGAVAARVPGRGKRSFSSLYFLGTYFKNNTVIDFTVQEIKFGKAYFVNTLIL